MLCLVVPTRHNECNLLVREKKSEIVAVLLRKGDVIHIGAYRVMNQDIWLLGKQIIETECKLLSATRIAYPMDITTT